MVLRHFQILCLALGTGKQDPDAEPALIGLDCEMCITDAGYELTRISLVSEQGEVTSSFCCHPYLFIASNLSLSVNIGSIMWRALS